MKRNAVSALLVAGSALLVTDALAFAGPSESAPAESPLAAYLGFGHHPDQEEALYTGEESHRQLLIETCMESAGFQYWTREPDWDPTSGEPQSPDPNQEYRDSLTPTQMIAYSVALSGRRSEDEGLTADEMDRFDANADGRLDATERSSMGCLGAASARVPGVFRVVGMLREEIQRMESEIRTSEIAAAAETGFVSCMNALGLAGRTTEAVRSEQISLAFADDKVVNSEACDSELARVMYPAVVTAETAFVERNRDVLDAFAVRAK